MPKAILSVHNKTGLVDFAKGLIDLGWEFIASGGTARYLRDNQLPVIEVSNYTGAPEMLGGRVKTLHPAIHAGILARESEEDRNELSRLGWGSIDLVVVNLYPFEETIAQSGVSLQAAIEQIDIGGVALMRAAAKNHQRVTLVSDPLDYPQVLQEMLSGGVKGEFRKRLAIKCFRITSRYDSLIADYLEGIETNQFSLYPQQFLRYGENPHQSAQLFGYQTGQGPLGGKILQGKELSYNNLLDLDAAWRAVLSFEKSSVVIVKHLSPCGIASAEVQLDAYQRALASDPVSAFGGIVALNRQLESDTAMALSKLFVECVIAPGFSPAALEILSQKKNLRILKMPDLKIEPLVEVRSIIRGVLQQSIDPGDPQDTSWQVVTKAQPTPEQLADLKFAWKACQHVKSNAIVFAKDEATLGIGGGQPNRVDCVDIATQRAGEKAHGAVMASDAFFPFADSVEKAAAAGITAIVQPGGSLRDQESIDACNRLGIAMVFTGVRHFRH
ncbi:MAG: bifunctional phosphoribosylaminoimidazolecarboxamide formyltransferase/IMP cyclohydrolase [Anaerolineaceae bacterium]|jgi:phosphoribosylaminoimidazolecarboxamide formyltransferase/IMP cyclohydrolase|nr:bifunctional phosphoribosylaminoimidazolecarboxamide formyltransferase/IMP cyclohydrolase [Anaerolineaceae bacterium]